MTGLIYVAIIAVWAVVLVPIWLRRHDHLDSTRSVDRFSRSLQALAQRDSILGIPLPEATDAPADPDQAEAAPEVIRVTRRGKQAAAGRGSGDSARANSKPRAGRAAGRRRIVLGLLGVGFAVVAGLVVRGVLLPIALLAPTVLIVGFLVAARRQVRAARRRPAPSPRATTSQPVPSAPQRRPDVSAPGATWEARPATLPTYVTAPPAAGFPRVIDTATPGAWTAAAMLERAQQQKARAERMAAAKAEAIARAKAEQAAAEARSRDDDFLSQQSTAWRAADTSAPLFRPRAVNE